MIPPNRAGANRLEVARLFIPQSGRASGRGSPQPRWPGFLRCTQASGESFSCGTDGICILGSKLLNPAD
jgi:hypothetical protein